MAAQTQSVAFSVEGKTAIVTGAGSGINFCFAKLLLSRNCNVVIADLNLRPEARDLLEKYTSNPRAAFVKTDVRLWHNLSNMFDYAEAEFGGFDLVCPGAGVFEPHFSNFWLPPGSKESIDDPYGRDAHGVGHYTALDINLTHPIRTTQIAIGRWLNQRKDSAGDKVSPMNPKRVVCISSIAGQTPGFPIPLYIASKHAISGFIRSMAELDSLGIRVNGVAPGIIKTPLWTDHPEKLGTIDEQRDTWIAPEEVAEQMVRCAEDDEIGAGTVWEVLKNAYRKVDWKDDHGRQGPGGGLSNPSFLVQQVFGWLSEPEWGQVAAIRKHSVPS